LRKEKDILACLDHELKQQGFVGSTEIPRLVFLSLYTALVRKAVSVVIKGPTASGKSFAVESAL
jgi:hypothetical protein